MNTPITLPEAVFRRLPDALQSLCSQWQAAQPLPKEHELRLWQRLRVEWNYHSNHIEGNTLTYGETLLLLIHGRTRGEHLLREYEEMRGHDVAIEWLRELATSDRLITEADIRDLNQMVLKEGFWRVAQTADGEPTRKWVEPGQYKTQANHVLTTAGEIFYFASPAETPALMAAFVQWLRDELQNPTLDLPALLVQLHSRFIRIHPFDDGNGRVVRLLLNYVLMRWKLLPLVINSRERNRYLSVIADSDTGNFAPFEQFMQEAIAWSLQLGITAAQQLLPLESADS